MNIIFVCTGNTCRSPMAEAYAKSIFCKVSADYNICSRGLMVESGSSISHNSVLVLKKHNIEITEHIPTSLSAEDVESADLILTMTASQCIYIKNALPQFGKKIFSLAEYTGTQDVSDPYGYGLNEYENAFDEISISVNALLNKLAYE